MHQKLAATVWVVAVHLTYASAALVNVAYLQPNVESQMDAIELATETVNVANRSRKIFYNFNLF